MSDQTTRVTPGPKPLPATAALRPIDAAGTPPPARILTQLLQANGLPVVPGYHVRREVARGGMGVVYAAHDPTFDREVAIEAEEIGDPRLSDPGTAQPLHGGETVAFARNAQAAPFGMRFGLTDSRGYGPKVL